VRRVVWALVFLLATRAHAVENPDSLFSEASTHYDAGRFLEASKLYDSLLSAGYKLPQVYFNLGNAQFRAGRLGEAIWGYRSALGLAPRDVDIEANLTVARLACRDKIEAAPPGLVKQIWRTASSVLSVSEGARLVTWLWWSLWVAISLAVFIPSVRIWTLPLVRLLALAWIVSASILGVRYMAHRNTQAGVVIAGETQARSAPGPDEDVAFTGHAGMECLVRGQRGEYLLIELANGRVGWIPVADLLQIES
jgi:hypothetical protein